ncbi:MAG: nitroreductase family protein [Pseudomonadota bacterium]|nr:nitroreductase family protein [Pseudomonadota bacterium]
METLREMIASRYGRETGIGDNTQENTKLTDFLSRRSIRVYKNDPVPEDLIQVLIACAQSAPTKSNLQQYSILVVKEQSIRSQLAPWCPRTKGLEYVPVLLVFCADIRRNQSVAKFRRKRYANNNMDTFLNATVDASLSMGFFVAAAEAAGLGCAPLSSLRDNIDAVSDILNLPKGVFPVAGVMCGWPKVEGYVNQRLPQSVIVHYDRYDDKNLEQNIDDYDQARHAIFPVPKEGQSKKDLFGTARFYGWSEHVSRQLAIPERANFRAFLLEHGFNLR